VHTAVRPRRSPAPPLSRPGDPALIHGRNAGTAQPDHRCRLDPGQPSRPARVGGSSEHRTARLTRPALTGLPRLTGTATLTRLPRPTRLPLTWLPRLTVTLTRLTRLPLTGLPRLTGTAHVEAAGAGLQVGGDSGHASADLRRRLRGGGAQGQQHDRHGGAQTHQPGRADAERRLPVRRPHPTAVAGGPGRGAGGPSERRGSHRVLTTVGMLAPRG
jgi:hypothetical protein